MVESGTHEQLYQTEGAYKRIFEAMARSLNVEKIAKTFEHKTENEQTYK